MSAFTIYSLNDTGQLDFFYNTEGKLDLRAVMQEMRRRLVAIGNDGKVIGEGFTAPQIFQRSPEKSTLECYGFQSVSLGTYFQSRMVNDDLIIDEATFDYFTKCKIIITEDLYLIVLSNNSTEEKGKSKVKTMVEDIGFEASIFKVNHPLLSNLQDDEEIRWSEAKIEKIEKVGDKTTKVSYEIDLADIVNRSQVADEYNGYGSLAHLKIQFPYENLGEADSVTINLYTNGHRVSFEEEELEGASVEEFSIHVLEFLLRYYRE